MAQFTTTEVAAKFETTPRNLRKFMRSDAKARNAADALPGKGSRYAIEGRDLAALKRRFKVWSEAQVEAKAKRDEVAPEVEVEVEVTDEVEGPTDDDLALIDDEG